MPLPLTRILIVEDSQVVGQMLKDFLSRDPALAVVGIAGSGEEAMALIPTLKPDAITLDLHLPGAMNGVALTQWVMAHHPTPILILASPAPGPCRELVFQAIACGALDTLEKRPAELMSPASPLGAELVARLKLLAETRVIRHPKGKLARMYSPLPKGTPAAQPRAHRLIALAASTGGPQTLVKLLKALPKDLACPVVIVQHMSKGFSEGFVAWLGRESPVPVVLAAAGTAVQPGTVYVSPAGVHLRVETGGRLALLDDQTGHSVKPSADVLFASVAEAYRERGIGVILTGMGEDGVRGLQAMHAAGATILAQDEETSVIFGMPKAAIEAGVVHEVLALDDIALRLQQLVSATTPKPA